MKKIAIMQPYFFPYIGYFQLIASVDQFIVYDNIQYTKKGWINRNRFLQNGKDVIFSIPLKKASDYLDIRERELSICFDKDKLLRQFESAYKKAPHFSSVFPIIEKIVNFNDKNLFRYIFNSIIHICQYLDIKTDIKISSDLKIDHDLKKQNKVIALCEASKANVYINAIGGNDMYRKGDFSSRSIELKFIQSKTFTYTQFDHHYVPWLSIIDIMFFNSKEKISRQLIKEYKLI